MAKAQKMITVDDTNWQRFKQAVGNASGHIDNYIQNYLASSGEHPDKVNLEILNVELKALEKEIVEKQAEYNGKLQLKEQHILSEEQKHLQRLKDEQTRLEKQAQCQNCGNTIPQTMKFHILPVGKICNSCFMTANGEDLKRWQ